MPPSVPVTQSPAAQRTNQKRSTLCKSSSLSKGAAATRKEFRSTGPGTTTATVDSGNEKRAAPQDKGDDVVASSATIGRTPINPMTSSAMFGSGTGMYGAGAYGGMMMGSPYGYGGMMPSGAGQPFSGLNQFLFSIQSVIFSLGQAVQASLFVCVSF